MLVDQIAHKLVLVVGDCFVCDYPGDPILIPDFGRVLDAWQLEWLGGGVVLLFDQLLRFIQGKSWIESLCWENRFVHKGYPSILRDLSLICFFSDYLSLDLREFSSLLLVFLWFHRYLYFGWALAIVYYLNLLLLWGHCLVSDWFLLMLRTQLLFKYRGWWPWCLRQHCCLSRIESFDWRHLTIIPLVNIRQFLVLVALAIVDDWRPFLGQLPLDDCHFLYFWCFFFAVHCERT